MTNDLLQSTPSSVHSPPLVSSLSYDLPPLITEKLSSIAVIPCPQACSILDNDFSHTSNSNHTLSRTGELSSLDPDWTEKQDSSHGLFVHASAFVSLFQCFFCFLLRFFLLGFSAFLLCFHPHRRSGGFLPVQPCLVSDGGL